VSEARATAQRGRGSATGAEARAFKSSRCSSPFSPASAGDRSRPFATGSRSAARYLLAQAARWVVTRVPPIRLRDEIERNFLLAAVSHPPTGSISTKAERFPLLFTSTWCVQPRQV